MSEPIIVPYDTSVKISNEEFWLLLKAVQKIKTHILPIGLLLSCEVLWNHLAHTFLMSKSCVKI